MNRVTQATLQQLEEAEWFSRVGVDDTETAEVLSSWYEAVQSCASPEWEDLCLEAANQYRERLVERSPERFSRWNEIVNELRPITQRLVREKTQEVVTAHSLPKVFVDQVDWDILHLCMEAEYQDVFPPAFYGAIAYWYTHGHFPCGWRGRFPDGQIVVY